MKTFPVAQRKICHDVCILIRVWELRSAILVLLRADCSRVLQAARILMLFIELF